MAALCKVLYTITSVRGQSLKKPNVSTKLSNHKEPLHSISIFVHFTAVLRLVACREEPGHSVSGSSLLSHH